MHKYLNKFALAGSAMALALVPAMASAQEQTLPETAPPVETAAPTAPATEAPTADTATPDPRLAALPADKQAAVQAWPAKTQDYYFSLTEERQQLFWMLSDPDKVRLSELPEDQQTSAWAQIESLPRPSQG